MNVMTWVKLFCEWASDPKVQTMTEPMQRRHAMLLCLCGQADPAQLTDREIAGYLRISRRQWERTRRLFVEKGFLEEDGSMPKFALRQAPSDPTAAHRMREYRRRQAERAADVTRNGSVTVRPRARQKEQKEGETSGARARNVTPNEPANPDPALAEVVRLATELGGPDCAAWAGRLARENPPGWVRDVLRKIAGRGDLREAYAEGILARYREQGGPDRAPGEPPAIATAPPPTPIAPPDYIPEGPEGDAIRRLYGLEVPDERPGQ